MTHTSNPRWFRFSLRTLLVTVTVVALWLGWNVEIVRRRTAVRNALLALGAEIDDEVVFPSEAPNQKRVSFIRRCVGDHAIWAITFPRPVARAS